MHKIPNRFQLKFYAIRERKIVNALDKTLLVWYHNVASINQDIRNEVFLWIFTALPTR